MKKATCSFLVGITITSLVLILLGVDILGKRRFKVSKLLSKDVHKNPQISDMQILSLVDKRIQKLEDTLNDFIHKTNEASKSKRADLTSKVFNFGESSKKSYPFDVIDKPSNMKDSNVRFVPLQPIVGKYVMDKTQQVSESTKAPMFSSYDALSNQLSNSDADDQIRNSPGYFKGLLGNFHIDLLKKAFENEKIIENREKNVTRDKNDIIDMTKDIFKREVVDLAPQKSDDSLKEKTPLADTQASRNKKISQNTPKFLEKPKPTGFLTRAVDEALIPSVNAPANTDFTPKDSNYRPIFFDDKSKVNQNPIELEKSKTPSLTSQIPSSSSKTPSSTNKMASSTSKTPSSTNKMPSDILKTPKLSNKDKKDIQDAIDNIFNNVPSSKKENVSKDGDIKFENSDMTKANKIFPLKDKTSKDSFKQDTKTKENNNESTEFPSHFETSLAKENTINLLTSNSDLPKPIDFNIKEYKDDRVLESDKKNVSDILPTNILGNDIEEVKNTTSEIKVKKQINTYDSPMKKTKKPMKHLKSKSTTKKSSKGKSPKIIKINTHKLSTKEVPKLVNTTIDNSAITSAEPELFLPENKKADSKLNDEQIDKILNSDYEVSELSQNINTPTKSDSIEFKIIKSMVDDLHNDMTNSKDTDIKDSMKSDEEESKLDKQNTSLVEI